MEHECHGDARVDYGAVASRVGEVAGAGAGADCEEEEYGRGKHKVYRELYRGM